MPKKTLFIYWFGKPNPNVERTLKLFKEAGIKVVQAQDDPDHEYLLKNSKVYKKYFAKKQYSFASDVWRFYKLANNANSIYLDAGDIYDNVQPILDFEETTLLKENIHFYNSGMIYNKDHCEFFQEVFEEVTKGMIGPPAVTKVAKRYGYFKKDWVKSNKINSISLYDFSEITTVNSYASWKNKKLVKEDNWTIKIWESKNHKYRKFSRKMLFVVYSMFPRMVSKIFTR